MATDYTAKELGFKYGVADVLAHVGQALDYGDAGSRAFVVRSAGVAYRCYQGHAYVVISCKLEVCSGGVQRSYCCRIADCGVITHQLCDFHEQELIPFAAAVAEAQVRQNKAEEKPDS